MELQLVTAYLKKRTSGPVEWRDIYREGKETKEESKQPKSEKEKDVGGNPDRLLQVREHSKHDLHTQREDLWRAMNDIG